MYPLPSQTSFFTSLRFDLLTFIFGLGIYNLPLGLEKMNQTLIYSLAIPFDFRATFWNEEYLVSY